MSIFKKCFALVAAGLAITSAFAQKPTAVKGLMWKATSGTSSIYMVGSIHIGSPKMYPLPSQYDEAFKRAKAVVVEADVNHIDPSMVATLMSDGMYSGDDNLFKHVSPDVAKQIRQFCKANPEFSEERFGQFKPWMASMMIEVAPALKSGMKVNLGIDEHFMSLATKAKKPIVEAESVDFQLKLLTSIPPDEQNDMLKDALKGQHDMKEGMGKLVSQWVAGDAASLTKEFIKEKPTKFDHRILLDRNPHMADVAEGFLKKKEPCLFIVGAAHLLGPDGVVSILKKRGYTVTQVKGPIGS
ncbi:MAG TPA: TraB/GumN family protein [Fimbriimonas sp.]|nr:TraB/GumN family protein [Fimbriimonas sp.]